MADFLTSVLTDVAAANVDRVVIITNLGTTTLTQPIAGSAVPPGVGGQLAAALQPRIEVYVKGSDSPAFVYEPYGTPTPTPAKTYGFGGAVAALLILGAVVAWRGVTK